MKIELSRDWTEFLNALISHRVRFVAEFAVAPLYVIGRAMLFKNKRAAGRDKDLADVAMLELHTPIKKPKRTAKTRR